MAASIHAAPRHQTMECRGGGAMSAEYRERPGSVSPVVAVRFARPRNGSELVAGQCRLRHGELMASGPTVLVCRARGEKISQFTIAPTPAIKGVVGPMLKRLIERVQNGMPFSMSVSNSGRGWWEIERLNP